MWCCGKVDVIVPGPPADSLKVDVAIAAKPIVLMCRADFDTQIVVKKVEEVVNTDVTDVEEELTNQTLTALLGIAFIFGATYLAFNMKPDKSFYIDAPHDL